MFIAHGQTDVGRRRKINEDSIFTADGLLIVCDGMGGHKSGEVASSLAVEAITRFIQRSNEDRELTWPYGFNPRMSYNGNRLLTAIKLANRTVFKKANSGEEYTGMGTTVVAVVMSPTEPLMTYGHVGDSRIYLIRGGVMLQLTRDDSWANIAWSGAPADDTGASTGTMKNILTKALGARDDVDFDVVDQTLSDGDVVLLCSDGLTNMLSDRRIFEIVSGPGDLETKCHELVSEANLQGGRDNISVILVQSRP